ncbi:hypothetical protein BC941DRAFT_472959 [Chlamydoabsidia padenii]|nr:hypothetical protein BC941DRAFT_472959 [Chlamydoabsidia padenii]
MPHSDYVSTMPHSDYVSTLPHSDHVSTMSHSDYVSTKSRSDYASTMPHSDYVFTMPRSTFIKKRQPFSYYIEQNKKLALLVEKGKQEIRDRQRELNEQQRQHASQLAQLKCQYNQHLAQVKHQYEADLEERTKRYQQWLKIEDDSRIKHPSDQVCPVVLTLCTKTKLEYTPKISQLNCDTLVHVRQILTFGSNVDGVLTFICDTKSLLIRGGKRIPQQYTNLLIMEQIVNNFCHWSTKRDESSNRNEQGDVLQWWFTSCLWSKNRLDPEMLASAMVDISSNEWKRAKVSNSVKLHQQSKNLQLNATNLFTLNTKFGVKTTVAMDFVGNSGYLYLLRILDDDDNNGLDSCVTVAYLVTTLVIPTNIESIVTWENTLRGLLTLKDRLVVIACKIRCELCQHGTNLNDTCIAPSTKQSSSQSPFIFVTPKNNRVKKRKLVSLYGDTPAVINVMYSSNNNNKALWKLNNTSPKIYSHPSP